MTNSLAEPARDYHRGVSCPAAGPDEGRPISTRENPRSVIVINCFGRGGSSFLWHIFGSSPDVVMTRGEWHQMLFPRARRLRKTLRAARRAIVLPGFDATLGRLTARRVSSCLEPVDTEYRCGSPSWICFKLMDQDIVFNEAVAHGFEIARFVALMRDPLAQCESLMRSGLTVQQACTWYNQVASLVKHEAEQRPDYRIYRFEDMLADPARFAQGVFRDLALSPRSDGMIRLKVKRFGDQRHGDVDAATSAKIWVPEYELRRFLNPAVNCEAAARLSEQERGYIKSRAGGLASYFGYT